MRPSMLFFGIAFGFSWLLGAVLFLIGPQAHIALRTTLMILYMFGPALGAVVAQRATGERVLAPLGVVLKPNRWWLVAWLLPFALQPLIMGVSLLLPGIEWSPEMAGFFERLAATLPPDQIEAARKQLEEMPRTLYWLMLFAQPLIAGISVNALAAFGEELGWRGFLFRRLAGLGFWRRSLVVGTIWGVWHAPIIMQGHNFPQHPFIGVLMMTLFTILLAPLLDLVRLRGGSVWAAAILHGTVNATAGFSIMFVKGGDDLVVGMTGLAGLMTLAVANGIVALIDRATNGSLTAPKK